MMCLTLSFTDVAEDICHETSIASAVKQKHGIQGAPKPCYEVVVKPCISEMMISVSWGGGGGNIYNGIPPTHEFLVPQKL